MGRSLFCIPPTQRAHPEQDFSNILKYVKENERHKTIHMKRRKKKNCRYTCLKFTGSPALECLAPLSITKSDSLKLFRKALKNSVLNCYIN